MANIESRHHRRSRRLLMADRQLGMRWNALSAGAFSRLLFVPVIALGLLILPELLCAQQSNSGGTGSSQKSAAPPLNSKDSGQGSQTLVGGAPPKASPPNPQGPIKNDDDPRVKAAVAKAVAYFRTVQYQQENVGELSLMVHALA